MRAGFIDWVPPPVSLRAHRSSASACLSRAPQAVGRGLRFVGPVMLVRRGQIPHLAPLGRPQDGQQAI